MKSYNLKIKLLSNTIITNGEGWAGVVDTEIIADNLGVPYIPARRLKGILKDSAFEVHNMFITAGVKIDNIDGLFGKSGSNSHSAFMISDAIVDDYESSREWLEYLISKNDLSRMDIYNYFTGIINTTAIDEKSGVVKYRSLRNHRYIKPGMEFISKITINDDSNKLIEEFLLYAVQNLNFIGLKRNRGFGHIDASLQNEEGKDLKIELANFLNNRKEVK